MATRNLLLCGYKVANRIHLLLLSVGGSCTCPLSGHGARGLVIWKQVCYILSKNIPVRTAQIGSEPNQTSSGTKSQENATHNATLGHTSHISDGRLHRVSTIQAATNINARHCQLRF